MAGAGSGVGIGAGVELGAGSGVFAAGEAEGAFVKAGPGSAGLAAQPPNRSAAKRKRAHRHKLGFMAISSVFFRGFIVYFMRLYGNYPFSCGTLGSV